MAYEVSRRSFLKGAAALAVATAASGLLTACGGGKEDAGFAIGDYRISGGAVEYWNADSQGRYTIETTVTITKTGSKSWTDWFNVFKNKKYDDIFSAKNMKLLNGDEKFEMPSKNDDVVCKLRFYTTDKTLFDKFVNGEEKMTLKIELARNQSKTFLVDVKNKTISGTI